jgi:type IV pilus assembly protein PilB
MSISFAYACSLPQAPGASFRLGEVLVREGLITAAQLAQALDRQAAGERYLPLGQILIESGAVARDRLGAALTRHGKRARLGELLVRAGAISQEQLSIALDQQRAAGGRLGDTLAHLNFVARDEVARLLWAQLNIPAVDLDRLPIEPEAARVVNAHYARRHRVVPVALSGRTLTVAIDDGAALDVLDELRRSTGYVVSPVAAPRAALDRGLARAYGGNAPVGDAEARLELLEDPGPEEGTRPYARHLRYLSEVHGDEIVRRLLLTAVTLRASDIHLEQLGDRVAVRFRIDGMLQERECGVPPSELARSAREIVSRLKILARLDIAERRRPQSGGFQARLARSGETLTFNFRVSIVPGYHGENVVVRVLDPRRAPRSVQRIGFSPALAETWLRLLSRPTGIILITGPTGSGKSTTLYASLNTLYRPAVKIVTAEDPIEYVYDNFCQSEVNPRVGNTFASYLRSFLRHDPEIIMIGEIRDEETAEMAFRAAQTGHLLLSTLHTNDALGAVPRLLDLGVEPSLIASSLLGVLSQRLLRAVCQECAVDYRPNPDVLRELFSVPPEGFRWRRGRGCSRCHHTGYRGRLPVGELWVPSEMDLLLINKGAPLAELAASARRSTVGVVQDLEETLRRGRTTPEEAVQALPYRWLVQFRERYGADPRESDGEALAAGVASLATPGR